MFENPSETPKTAPMPNPSAMQKLLETQLQRIRNPSLAENAQRKPTVTEKDGNRNFDGLTAEKDGRLLSR